TVAAPPLTAAAGDTATRGAPVAATSCESMPERVTGEEITAGEVEREAWREPVRQADVDFRSEVVRITLRTRTAASRAEGRQQTSRRHEDAIRVDFVMRPGRRDTSADRERRREGIRHLRAELHATVLVVADGHAGVQTADVGVQDVEVVDTEREDLGTPVSQIAGIGIQRLVVVDRLERVALRIL